MHELGLMASVMDAVEASAHAAGAKRVLKVSLSVGEMTEAIEDALVFAFDILTKGTISEGACFEVNMIRPKSRCLECGAVYEHDRFHMLCPRCGSFATELIAGRELEIDSIEVDIADEEDEVAHGTEDDVDCGVESNVDCGVESKEKSDTDCHTTNKAECEANIKE